MDARVRTAQHQSNCTCYARLLTSTYPRIDDCARERGGFQLLEEDDEIGGFQLYYGGLGRARGG